jgi:flagellar assembly protein FliH
MSYKSSKAAKAAAVSAEPFLYVPAPAEKSSRPSTFNREAGSAGSVSSNVDQKSYDRGLADGEARVRAAFEKSLADVRGEISLALRQFTAQRETYFSRVELEVVQLALSIARKILHREAKIDPLLLTGVVRVALESLNDGTQVRMRTNPDEIRFWREYFSQATDISPTPELIGDSSLSSGSCALETDMGNTLVSFEAQLKEIEQGFLDLLDRRPRAVE